MQHYILAIDQGTTSTRVLLFDQAGQPKCGPQIELPQAYPNKGWVEQDPLLIWKHVQQLIQDTMKQYDLSAAHIAGVAITNQRETTVVWDKATGQPIYPAIVWQDRRTGSECKLLKYQNTEKMIHEKTGLILDPYFSATKLAWILAHVPGARDKANAGELAFGTIDCFLCWQLSGGKQHVTDVTNASRTLLFNINTLQWDDELLELFKIPKSILPEVKPCDGEFGQTTTEGVGYQWPILAVAGDQQAALFGQACIEPGHSKATFGTGCFLMQNTGEKIVYSSYRLLTTVGYQLEGKAIYAMEGSIFMSGAIIQWLKQQLQVIQTSEESEHLARGVEDNNGVYMIPAFNGLGAPNWRPDIRASIVGLTRESSKAHVVRAGLEAVAYQVKDLFDAIDKDTGFLLSSLKTDGGMIQNQWLMQFIADILNCKVECAKIAETTAFGVALMAGIKLKWWAMTDVKTLWRRQTEFQPQLEENIRDKWYQGWCQAIEQVLG